MGVYSTGVLCLRTDFPIYLSPWLYMYCQPIFYNTIGNFDQRPKQYSHGMPHLFTLREICICLLHVIKPDGWMNQAYSRLSTTHGHITDCKLLARMYWTRLVLVRPAASLYSASPLKHHATGRQRCPNPILCVERMTKNALLTYGIFWYLYLVSQRYIVSGSTVNQV